MPHTTSTEDAPTAGPVSPEKRTALHATHQRLGAVFTDFGGWQMPLRYGSEIAEHHAVRRTAGVFDLSHMGEVHVSGADAGRFLDYALVGRLSAIAIGRAAYSLMCDETGGIIDDLIAYRLADSGYLIVPNAGNAETVVAELIRRAAGYDVVVVDASRETSLIAVQGPNAEAILRDLVHPDEAERVEGLRYYAFAPVSVSSRSVLLARTGYTGEDGFELFVPSEHAAELWEAITLAGGPYDLAPCGLAARDSLRLEAGMPLYGNELSRDGNPYAAGLGSVVALAKEGDFVGREALEALRDLGAGRTSGRRLVGLRGAGKRAGRSHYRVIADDVVIGEVTSGQPSPTLGHQIALALVDVDHAEPGMEVEIDVRGKREPFTVVRLPFYERDKSSPREGATTGKGGHR